MTEIWKGITGYEGVYSVSNYGRIRRELSRTCAKAGSILKPSLRVGYPFVQLCRDGVSTSVSIHRVVAEAFIGPCPAGHCVNHKDLDRTNNRDTNLEYVTQSQNVAHAYFMGARDCRGEGNGKAVLTNSQVIEIFSRCHKRGDQAALAREYGISPTTVRQIVIGKRWSHVTGKRAA